MIQFRYPPAHLADLLDCALRLAEGALRALLSHLPPTVSEAHALLRLAVLESTGWPVACPDGGLVVARLRQQPAPSPVVERPMAHHAQLACASLEAIQHIAMWTATDALDLAPSVLEFSQFLPELIEAVNTASAEWPDE